MEIKADCGFAFRSQVERACCQFPSAGNRLAPVVNGTSGQSEASVMFFSGQKAEQKANVFKGEGELVL